MSGERRLIVNADDFGRSPGINAGILECHLDGIVTSTTLMANLDWAADAVARLEACPALGVGLHLNFCYGRPVSKAAAVASLVRDNGTFVTDTTWLMENASDSDIFTEAAAQLDRFRALLGREPTHLDSHKYLHSYPRIRRVVIDVARRSGLPLRAVTEEDRRAIGDAGLRTADRFEDRFHGLDGIGVSFEILERAILDTPSGLTELMCHPGFVDEYILDSSYAADREREIEALRDPRIIDHITRLGIRLVTFADLRGDR